MHTSDGGSVMRRLWIALLLWAAPAWADVTIYNFNGDTTAGLTNLSHRIATHDVAGNGLPALDGNILQVGPCPGGGCLFYRYSVGQECGFRYTIASPWCGVEAWSSPDLTNWTYLGTMFNPTTTYWQNRCSPSIGGCFGPQVRYNAANNNYVMTFIQSSGSSPASAQGVFVFTCTAPTPGSCRQAADVSHLAHTTRAGNFMPFIDNDGSGYVIYNDVSAHKVYIDRLNTSYTDSTGTGVYTGQSGESVFLLHVGRVYFFAWGQLCSYCSSGATVAYATGAAPLGPFSGSSALNHCGGQMNTLNMLTIRGSPVYLLDFSLWNGLHNQGWGSQYYAPPLSVSGSTIANAACAASVTVPGLTRAGAYPTPAFTTPPPDQTSVMNGVFNDRCDINASVWRLQTFVPTASTLYAIATPIGINNPFLAGSEPHTDGSLEIDVVPVTGNVPGTALGTVTIPASSLKWVTEWTKVVFNLSGLTVGRTYGILLKGVGTTQGCFSNTVAQGFSGGSVFNAYPAGLEASTHNGGSTWATESNFAFMFSTFPLSGPVQLRPGRSPLLRR